MTKKIRALGAVVLVSLWAILSLTAWFSADKERSEAERRPLQQKPLLTADTLLSGSYMEKFEDYSVDQFPLRDSFRTAKSLFSYGALRKKDNNGIYIADGYGAKLDYPVNDASLSYAQKKLNAIYRQYLEGTDCRIYMTIVPDKGYYLAEPNGYPAMDYGKLFSYMAENMPWAQMVDITQILRISDYYRTDTHWRQERLLKTAQTLCRAMGAAEPKEEDFAPVLATQKFYGVYYGQAALPMKPEELYVMESPLLKACRVYNYETGRYTDIYDREGLSGADPYDVYLSGAQAILTVENPHADTDRELIMFRDSFASTLAPLLVQGYRTVTLVDIRYVSSALLSDYLTFQEQDILFVYSTLILNNSASLK